MMRRWLVLLLLIVLALPVIAQDPPAPTVERLIPKIINVYPHDPTAFTQGLLFHEGILYESTGLYGESTLRQVDPTTGEVLKNVVVSRPSGDKAKGLQDYFAEGLAIRDGKLIQLTWKDEVAFVYDLETFEKQEDLPYEGEGWGLCSDGRYFYMSDSTNYLSLRDLDSFDLIVEFLVTLNGQPLPVNFLNELECVDEAIYANMWQTDFIVRIDKTNGNVTAVIDATNLLSAEDKATLQANQVLNGIAYNPDTKTFFITGKQWPKMFEVEFVPAPPEE
jgi:glutaminyl-peptide cyclotransferase